MQRKEHESDNYSVFRVSYTPETDLPRDIDPTQRYAPTQLAPPNLIAARAAMDNQVELLYSKAKVYIHPSKSSKDNIPGYLSLVRRQGQPDENILASWVPESLIRENQSDYESYVQVDLDSKSGDISTAKRVLVSAPTLARSTFAFSIPISNIYSVQERLPSPGWWWGSLLFFTRDETTLPALFFHDSESESTQAAQRRLNSEFDTFSNSGSLWGGSIFMTTLSKYAKVVPSTIEPAVKLVNPSTADKLSFSPATAKYQRAGAGAGPSNSPKKPTAASRSWNDAKWGLLEKLAQVTRFSRQAGQQVLDRTPAPVKAILNVPEVEQLSRDFDSARLYLAEWALGIAEDTRRSRYDVVWTDGFDDSVISSVGEFDMVDISHGAERRNPVTLAEWKSFFDHQGYFSVTVSEVKERIFHGGLEPSVRPEAWLFLLGVYPWDSNSSERASLLSEKRNEYYRLKRRWWDDVGRQESDAFWKDQKSRIEKDVLRTDRDLEIFSQSDVPHPDPESRFASNGANPHLEQLRDLLITYNEYNENLGYIQGMSDLLSPLYVSMQDDAVAFWAFVAYMRRMERNFLRDQSGMRHQLETLGHLTQLMLPKLYDHLHKAESTHFFFFFRMLLVWYKREFEWDQVLKLWDVLFTDYLSSQFHLFIALAILDLNKETLMTTMHQFDEILKYINDLGLSMDVDDVLVRAEQLFTRFRHTVNIVDRKHKDGAAGLPEIPDDVRQLLSTEIIEVREVARPPDATGG